VGPSGSREIGAGLVDNFLVGVWELNDRIAHYRDPGHRLGPLGEGLLHCPDGTRKTTQSRETRKKPISGTGHNGQLARSTMDNG
jgi:hypothetical protein